MPRIGFVTPSKFKVLLVGDGKNWSEGAKTYAEEIACEMFFGVSKEQVKSKSLDRGNENEWLALKAYEESEIVILEKPGFTVHPDPAFFFIGGTPDGIVDEFGGVDTKCPNSENHYKNIKRGEQLKIYNPQFQGYMWIFDKIWWDMASYDERFPEFARLCITRVERDQKLIDEIAVRVARFWWELVQKELSELRKLYPGHKAFFEH